MAECNDSNYLDLISNLELLIESLLGIIHENEEKANYNPIDYKLTDNKEFFREFITLEHKITNIINELNNYDNKPTRKTKLLIHKYKEVCEIYQCTWKDSYWLMYNSAKAETEYCTLASKEDLFDAEDIELQQIDQYIDSLHSEEIKRSNLDKKRHCCSCLIF
jgi:hypothetical protein